MIIRGKVLEGKRYWAPFGSIAPAVGLPDVSRWGNDGTFGAGAAAPTWVQEPSGAWVLSYDGADYVNFGVGNNDSFDTEQAMSISVWASRTGGLAAERTIMSRYTTTANQRIWALIFTAANTLEFRVSRDGGAVNMTQIDSAPVIYTALNVWYHIVATYLFVTDGTSQMRLYINGVLEGTSNTAVGDIFKPTAASPVYLSAIDIGGALNWFHIGRISPLVIVNYTMSQDEANKIFQSERYLFDA